MVETKTKNKKSGNSFFADIIAAIDYSDKPIKPKNESLIAALNRMIAAGASFDVAADDFQVCGADRLTESDKSFLRRNQSNALCHLQQSLLMKHWFSHSPEQFEDFAFEIAEREAIMTDGAEIPFTVYCEAVKEVSRLWFDRLLKGMA